MFGFLKNKLKGVLSKFSKKVEESTEEVQEAEKIEEELEESHEEKKEAEEIEGDLEELKEIETQLEEEKIEEAKDTVREIEDLPEKEAVAEPEFEKSIKEIEKPIEKKGILAKLKQRITTTKISESQFETLFWDVELALLENNVAVEVVEKIKSDLKKELVEKPLPRKDIQGTIIKSLKDSILELFEEPSTEFLDKVRSKKPFVICFFGVNGSGKTTSIAKVAKLLQEKGLSVIMAAADTFRAAAIDQLQLHADKLKIRLIRHEYGADAAAVAFDAVKHAESKGKDVVLIDTAGRLHSNVNLMDEMKKIIRVAKPDLKVFVGESITGNDCVEQAKKFDEAVGIDGVILAKADVDEKGGAALSVSYITKKPLLFLGTGQEYGDLIDFNKEKLVASLGL